MTSDDWKDPERVLWFLRTASTGASLMIVRGYLEDLAAKDVEIRQLKAQLDGAMAHLNDTDDSLHEQVTRLTRERDGAIKERDALRAMSRLDAAHFKDKLRTETKGNQRLAHEVCVTEQACALALQQRDQAIRDCAKAEATRDSYEFQYTRLKEQSEARIPELHTARAWAKRWKMAAWEYKRDFRIAKHMRDKYAQSIEATRAEYEKFKKERGE